MFVGWSVIAGGPIRHQYRLAIVRFHWSDADTSGSEHYIDGKPFPLEVRMSAMVMTTNIYNGKAFVKILI